MTQVEITGQVGPAVVQDGADVPVRLGRGAEQVFTELHGRFYEQTFRGNVFSDGMAATSISAATFTTATVGATATPITGVWNPSTSTVNLVILQAILSVSQTALQATGPGAFAWMTSVGNGALTLGSTPLNRKTLVAAGSFAKGLSGIALTGLTTNLAVRFASALGGGSAIGTAFLATQAGAQTVQAPANVENIDGSIIVPPGGILALMCSITPVGHSAASGLVWEEVPI
jgi:hypothetical protein